MFLVSFIKYIYHYHIEWYWFHLIHYLYISRLRRKEKIKVVFYAMNVSMWNYQHLYNLLAKNTRFDLYVILSPNYSFPISLRKKDADNMRFYFQANNVHYVDCNENGEVGIDVKKRINPDLIFYSQPYISVISPKDYCTNYQNKLICYYPYAFWSACGEWAYNMDLHRKAWKLFYSTSLHLDDARRTCYNKGRNVVVTGYPKTDDYMHNSYKDVWKIKDRSYKRIIWAPHFTLSPSLNGTIARSNFLYMSSFMIDIAKKYSDVIQIAFKPHPRLRKELYQQEGWGEKRTEEYYKKWNEMPNTFVVEGDYIDLFMTSDAMVHDCSSFSIEYLYTQNPVMYISQDINAYKSMLNEFGKKAIDLNYIGSSKQNILNFIEDIVLNGNDKLKKDRSFFYEKYLLPPHRKNVAEFTYNNIVTALKIAP